MSFPGFHTKTVWRTIFPFTWRGVFFFFLSLVILTPGIIRSELAALLWGSGFMLLVLYAFGGNHIFRFITKKHLLKTLDAVDCNLPTRGLFPRIKGIAEIKVMLPRIAIPGFQVRFVHCLHWHERPPICVETLLTRGRNTKIVDFTPENRGCYKSSFANLEFKDILGFTKGFLQVRLAEQVRVFPSVDSLEEWKSRIVPGEDDDDYIKKTQRSEELLEVRKYVPGDDIRKINWKIFAHLDEIFIRIGEETHPPESRLLIVLDPTTSAYLPKELSGEYLDDLIEACASVMNLLLLRGLQPMFTTSGGGHPGAFSLEKRRELFSLLSEIWWTKKFALRLPEKTKMQVIVFSSPGSASLEKILYSIHSRNWGVNLYLKRLHYLPPVKKKKSLQNLLFIPEEDDIWAKHRNFEDRVKLFNESLVQEIAKYRSSPWRLKLVSEI